MSALSNTKSLSNDAAFKDSMAMMAAAVKVVATHGVAGKAGLTVTAACSVSQDPPRLLVCVNQSASAHDVLLENKKLSLNVLSDQHCDVALAFGGKESGEKRFSFGEWSDDIFGLPCLDNICAYFSCSIQDYYKSGTHTIIVCNVDFCTNNDSMRPLVYFNRNMQALVS